MAQSAPHFYRKVSHVVNGSQYFHQLCKRVVLSAWLLHSAVESILVVLQSDQKDRLRRRRPISLTANSTFLMSYCYNNEPLDR